jgi:hypothetical protein
MLSVRMTGLRIGPDSGSWERCVLQRFVPFRLVLACLIFVFLGSAFTLGLPSPKRDTEAKNAFITDLSASEADVLQAVKEVVQDQVVHGTFQFANEKDMAGARAAESASAFAPWTGPGTVFFKVADNVLSPRNFKNSNDLGTVTVRYIVQSVDPSTTSLRIESVFIETNRRTVHPSEGVVETAEYAVIQQRVQAIQFERKEAADEQAKNEQQRAAKQAEAEKAAREAGLSAAAASSVQELEQRVEKLRHQAEAKVKLKDTPLKSAPYRSAATIQPLPANAQVVILILTPFWYGVETQDGHRGWIHREQLEQLQ